MAIGMSRSPRLDLVNRELMLRNAARVWKVRKKMNPAVFVPFLWEVVAGLTSVNAESAKAICAELGWNADAPASEDLPC